MPPLTATRSTLAVIVAVDSMLEPETSTSFLYIKHEK